MPDVTVDLFGDADPKDALVVVAFHSTGAAAAIAAAYLRQELDLPLVGHVRAPGLGPVVHIQDGIATSPIRIYGGEVDCGLDKECSKLYLVVAEFPIDLAIVEDIAAAITHWAAEGRMVLCLDAVVREQSDDEPDVFAVADRAATLEQLAATKADPLPGGVLVGMTGAVLSRTRDEGPRGAALVVEAARNHPDGRAAAALVTRLDPLLPEIRIDPQPLLDEAMAIEQKLQQAMRDAEAAQHKRPQHTFI